MPDNLQNIATNAAPRNKRNMYIFVAVFSVVCIALALFTLNSTNKLLKNNEIPQENTQKKVPISNSKSFEGRVKYIDPKFYPLDNISYVLLDKDDKSIILLKADDQKLVVVEGLNVMVFGQVKKTADKKEDVLLVEKIVVKR